MSITFPTLSRLPSVRKSYDFLPAAADFARANPGQCILAGQTPPSYVTQVKRAALKPFMPAGSFDASCRGIQGGQGDLYIRFIA